MPWSESKSFCQTLGGNLIQVRSRAIFYYIEFPSRSSRFWIGINDIRKEREFEWDDGLRCKFRNWLSGEPNNDKGPYPIEHCMEFQVNNGQWNDVSCIFMHPFACTVKGL